MSRCATIAQVRDTQLASSAPARIPTAQADGIDTHDTHLDVLFRAAYGLCGSVSLAERLAGEVWAQTSGCRHQRSPLDPAALVEALCERWRLGHSNGPAADTTDGDDAPFVLDGPASSLANLADVRACYRALQRLPAAEREALVAIDVVGLPRDQAAHALKTTPQALASRVFAARDRLANELERHTPIPPRCR
jgi:DNA-directed RNA polymerase specialized sigma24 family protein